MSQIYKRRWTTTTGKTREAYRIDFQVNGKWKQRQFKSKSAASLFVKSLTTYVEEEERPRDPTVAEVGELWIEACRIGRDGELPLEPDTVKGYEAFLRNHINPAFGEREITSLTRKEVALFRDQLLLKVARVTAKKILGALRSVCGHAIRHEILVADPTLKIGVRTGGRHKIQVAIPTKTEMTAIVAKAVALANGKSKQRRAAWTRYSLMLELMVYCGLRLSEVRGLPRHALSFQEAKLSIIQRADRRGRIGSPKSVRSRRTLYMPETLSQRLQEWVRTHNHELVFATATGLPQTGVNVRKRMWLRLLKLTECPLYHLHSTRHFFASRLIEKGCSPKELSEQMGHADEAFTLSTYGHLFKDAENERRRKERSNDLVLT
jgi:integrase